VKPPIDRADFGDALTYSRVMREHGPTSADDIDAFVGLAGSDGDLLTAVWGDGAAREAEWPDDIKREAFRRWHCLVEKFPRRSSARASDRSTLLTEAQVGETLSAAEFARERGWLLDFSATLAFEKMGAMTTSEVQACLRRYTKCLSQNLRDAELPVAFVCVVENSASVGLHAHVLLNAPIEMRSRIEGWQERFVRREAKARAVQFDATAITCSRHRKRHPRLHHRLVAYILKGADYSTVVQERAVSPDGWPVRLGDLLANEFVDPGLVPFDRLVIGSAIAKAARGGWRSAWERGCRDVNDLYEESFLKWVRHRYSPVVPPRARDLVPLGCLTEELFVLLDVGELALGDVASIAVPNLEIVAHRLDRLAYDVRFYDAAAYGASKHAALAAVALSIRSAHGAIEIHGARVHALVVVTGGLGGMAELRALMRAHEIVADLSARMGQVVARPVWMRELDLTGLAV
jgi:hypothetical protein